MAPGIFTPTVTLPTRAASSSVAGLNVSVPGCGAASTPGGRAPSAPIPLARAVAEAAGASLSAPACPASVPARPAMGSACGELVEEGSGRVTTSVISTVRPTTGDAAGAAASDPVGTSRPPAARAPAPAELSSTRPSAVGSTNAARSAGLRAALEALAWRGEWVIDSELACWPSQECLGGTPVPPTHFDGIVEIVCAALKCRERGRSHPRFEPDRGLRRTHRGRRQSP